MPVPLQSRRTRLVPPDNVLVERLFLGAMVGEFPWLWRGAPQTPAHFEGALWRDVVLQYAIEDRRTGEQIGLIGAHDLNRLHRYAYASFTLLPEYKRRIWPFEAVVLFANLLFTRLDLENIYAETTSSLYEDFRSGAGRFFTELVRFPGRLLVNGEREDLVVAGMSRDQWLTEGAPLLERFATSTGVEVHDP